MKAFRSLKNNLLIALDGTEYFSSNQIHRQHCSSRNCRNGTTHYFHTVVTPVIVMLFLILLVVPINYLNSTYLIIQNI
ncbi:hypothetical protein CDG77_28290 [Nostoc sp. 'Peltigera membranacea cyanobiont' 213]|nr:hypothetical protein CDG77_28290 [Nostoc sp. 'Peltigera membranacea cyanobiont' 213]